MMRTFGRLLQLVAPFKGWVALSALLGFATVGSGVGLMATAAFIIASAALHPSVADLAVPIVGVRFFGISRGVFRYLERYVSHRVTFWLLARLRVWFYRSVEPLAPARLSDHRSGDLLSRVVGDIETLQHFYVRVIAPPAVALLVGLSVWLLFRSYDLRLANLLVVFLLLTGVGVPLLVHRLSSESGREMARLRSELSVHLVDGIQGMADLVAFGQDGRQRERVRLLSRDWTRVQDRMARVGGLHAALGTMLANLGMWAVVVLAVPLVAEGTLEGVYLPVLALAALASFEAVLPLPLAFQYLGHSLEAGRRLFEIVGDCPPVAARQPVAGARRKQAPAPDLVVDNLRFSYGPDEPPALDGVSFELPQGRRTAIVGPSGAGKSTLANLILRFWDYQQGRILLGGRELREYGEEELRGLIGVVSQRTHLFSGTVRENLLIARPDADDAELLRAAELARLHPFVRTLPRGYDTWIGEQGARLSAGERQRVAIARALLKDAPLLILDEATANLDNLTEREVMEAIHSLMEGRTTLIITHRLVGLEMADEVLVLKTGRVVERGTHAELLRLGGLYSRMWELQQQTLAGQIP